MQINCYLLNARWVLYTRLDMFMLDCADELLAMDVHVGRGYEAASMTVLLFQTLPVDLMPNMWLFEHQTIQAFWVLFIAVMTHPTIPAAEEYHNLMSSVAEGLAVEENADTILSNKVLAQFAMLYCRVARLERRARLKAGR